MNIANKHGYTALLYGITQCSFTCINSLIQAGADVNTVHKKGYIVLNQAIYSDDLNITRAVLKAGSFINRLNDANHNALMNTLSPNSPSILRSEDLVMLLFAAGEIVNYMMFWARVPEYLQHADLKFCLKHHCREAIRKHLIKLNPHENLFGRIPKLGLPSSVEEYLLYNMSLEFTDPKTS